MRMVAMDEKDFGARCAVERDAHAIIYVTA